MSSTVALLLSSQLKKSETVARKSGINFGSSLNDVGYLANVYWSKKHRCFAVGVDGRTFEVYTTVDGEEFINFNRPLC